jgi:hypothetical protein
MFSIHPYYVYVTIELYSTETRDVRKHGKEVYLYHHSSSQGYQYAYPKNLQRARMVGVYPNRKLLVGSDIVQYVR